MMTIFSIQFNSPFTEQAKETRKQLILNISLNFIFEYFFVSSMDYENLDVLQGEKNVQFKKCS